MVLFRLSRQLSRPAHSLLSARAAASVTSRSAAKWHFGGARTLTATPRLQVKVLLVLYDGFQHAIDQPALLGTTENELGIRKWLEDQGHTLVTTSDKEGENSQFDQHLVDAEVIITTPYVLPRSSCTLQLLSVTNLLAFTGSTLGISRPNALRKPRSSRLQSPLVLALTTLI
jgi:hypothetical protein